MSGIAGRLAQVQARLRAAAERAGRDPDTIALMAVSKFQPLAAMREAYAAGQRLFGENYAQELREKAKALADLPELRLHFIGSLQKNKARYVVAGAAAFEALDDLELARELDRRATAAGRVLPVLVEVNFGEAQKAGVRPEALPGFLAALAPLPSLAVEGLMGIPPPSDDPQQSRPYFRTLATLARHSGLKTVSMGMSADFEVAIEEGSTQVRVGTAIFGARPPGGFGGP